MRSGARATFKRAANTPASAIAILVVLFAAIGWLAATVITAISEGEGHGPVFWSAIGLFVLLIGGLAALSWLIIRALAQSNRTKGRNKA
jgi:hypothetical protein